MNNVILTNILKQYEKKRLLAEKDLENRKNKLYSENIRLEEIDTELSKIGIETAKSLIMSNNSKVLEDLNKKVNVFYIKPLPYLTRVFSTSTYGVVTYAKTVMNYMQIFVDFGFVLSATKDIVKCRENKQNMGMHCEKCKKKTKRHCKMVHHDV